MMAAGRSSHQSTSPGSLARTRCCSAHVLCGEEKKTQPVRSQSQYADAFACRPDLVEESGKRADATARTKARIQQRRSSQLRLPFLSSTHLSGSLSLARSLAAGRLGLDWINSCSAPCSARWSGRQVGNVQLASQLHPARRLSLLAAPGGIFIRRLANHVLAGGTSLFFIREPCACKTGKICPSKWRPQRSGIRSIHSSDTGKLEEERSTTVWSKLRSSIVKTIGNSVGEDISETHLCV